MKVSIIFLTLNEEQDLPHALNAVRDLGALYVVDSGSEDRTVEIAKEAGASVAYHPFEGFGQQRNWALDHFNFESDWVLFLDADEIATAEFIAEIRKALETVDHDVAGFFCCWKLMLQGRWLRRSDNFPKWQFRLLRHKRARFIDSGHGQKEGEIDGRISYIQEPYLHYGFSKGWSDWIAKHNRYSSKEALERLNGRRPFKECFSKTGSIRNRALKFWLTGIPLWPAFRFFYSYILRGGFLEGYPGFIYCTLMGFYEFLIKIKMHELRNHNSPEIVIKSQSD